MLAADAGVCYDESERCPQFASDGKCINSALHKFANYCKKACGLCGLSRSTMTFFMPPPTVDLVGGGHYVFGLSVRPSVVH